MRSAYIVIAVTVYSALAPLPANAEIGTDRLVEAAILASTNMIDEALERSFPDQSFCIGARLTPSKTGFGLEDLPDSALAQIRDRFKDRAIIGPASSCKVDQWFMVATDAAGHPAWLIQYTDVDVLFSETLRRLGRPLTARGDRTSLNSNRNPPEEWRWLWWLTREDGRVEFDGSGRISAAFSEARLFYYDFAENEKGVRLTGRIEDSLPPRYEKYE